MKVLLSHSYFLRFDPKQFEAATPYPPLGTLYAAAVLRSAGYEVRVHDIQLADSPDSVIPVLNGFRPDIFVIYDDGFNYLTKMCLTNMREAAFKMQLLAKQQGCKVITCSSDAADHYDKYLLNGADVVIRGEGEETLLELCRVIDQKSTCDRVKGIAYTAQNKIQLTEKRQVIRDLDNLPLPAWDLIDLKSYEQIWREKHGYFSLNMVSTRGCPYKCNWCAKPIYGNRYNSHSPENVLKQIEALQQQTSFEHIWFADDIFGLKPGWLKEFAALKKKKGLSFRYKIQSRADLLLEEENIRYLAESGCETVWMGAESGSQKILDAMDKGIKVEEIYTAAKLLRQHQIRTAFFLQFGYPGEELNDIQLTIKMVNELLPDDIGISVSYPLPGTPFYDKVKQELKQKSNWTDSDDLSLMFRNNFPPEFYKQLHRYIHKNYRKHQSLSLLAQLFRGKAGAGAFRRMMALPYYSVSSVIEKRKLKQILPHESSSL